MNHQTAIQTLFLHIFLHTVTFFMLLPCTGIHLTTESDAVIYGRTLEFGKNLASNILYIPRNYSFTATGPTGNSNGLQWQSNYAVVGANALGINQIIDGVNEVGLAGGLFYFPDYATYQQVSPEDASHSLAAWELMTWILTNFATTQEIEKALHTIKVSNVIFPQWKEVIPIHAIVHDAKGNCIVIEYVKGKLHIHNNPIGVITNSPTFDWHITNVSNYINLSAMNVPKIELTHTTFKALGQGSGMLGLPGDFTPPSRFIRATAFSQNIIPLITEQEAVDTAFHILNLFDIPKGVIRDAKGNASIDYTQWTSVSDTKNKRFYFHTYANRNVKMVDLMKLSAQEKKILVFPMESPQEIIDITSITKTPAHMHQ